nr:hypothetical protein [Candidatus Sigynarchaeota archaeon]
EFQGLMIEWMDKMDQRGVTRMTNISGTLYNGTTLLKRLMNSGQVQLILVQYSDALALAYPYIDMYKSINYTHAMLDRLGFTNESAISRAVILQEGQFMLGMSRVAGDFMRADGSPWYDVLMTTRESLSYFGVDTVAPIYSYEFGGVGVYVLPYHVTALEAGVIHHVLWFQDGENVNSAEGETWGGNEGEEPSDNATFFPFSQERQDNHEKRIMDLEQQGNIFMTLNEWVDYLVSRNEAKPLGRWVPETHWAAFRYRSSLIWMGETVGGTAYDDNDINTRNYHTHQYLLATETLLNYTHGLGSIDASNYTQLYAILEKAWMDLADAEVTDSTGLGPRDYEGENAINKTRYARDNASIILKSIITATPSLNDSVYGRNETIQVIPAGAIGTSPVVRVNGTTAVNYKVVGPGSLGDLDTVGIQTVNNDSFQITKMLLEVPGNTVLDGLTYLSVKINFPRTNISSLDERWSYVKFTGDFSGLSYTPSLWDDVADTTIELDRNDYNPDAGDAWEEWDDYEPDNFQIYLALANGLAYSSNGAFAIIKNCSTVHLAAKWNTADIRFMQTETRSAFNASGQTWEFFVIPIANIAHATGFANLVNPRAPLTISRWMLP